MAAKKKSRKQTAKQKAAAKKNWVKKVNAAKKFVAKWGKTVK